MTKNNINRLLTEREGRTREYLHEVITEYGPSAARTLQRTTKGQYFPVRLEQARLVSSSSYCTRAKLILNLPAF